MNDTGGIIYNQISTWAFRDPVVSWKLRGVARGNADALRMWYRPSYQLDGYMLAVGSPRYIIETSAVDSEEFVWRWSEEWFGYEQYAQLFVTLADWSEAIPGVRNVRVTARLYNRTSDPPDYAEHGWTFRKADIEPSGHNPSDDTTWMPWKSELWEIPSTGVGGRTLRPAQGKIEPDAFELRVSVTGDVTGPTLDTVLLSTVRIDIFGAALAITPEPIPQDQENPL